LTAKLSAEKDGYMSSTKRIQDLSSVRVNRSA